MASLILVAALASCVSAAPRGIVVVPHGLIEVRVSQTEAWQPLEKPASLAEGNEVKTGPESTADVLLSDGSKLSLSSKAEFAVESTKTVETAFKLGLGKMKAYFAGAFAGRMKVRTPTAVAAVRGTEFELSAGQDGRTQVTVDEGHLEVSDKQGRQAVITSEETLSIGEGGMDKPVFVSLHDEHAQQPVRPFAVRMELANDQTRGMVEELRNRELKANEAQLGKTVVDAFGRRVRLEEYVLRPASNIFKLLFLSHRENRFDWGHITETFHGRIPDDITRVGEIVRQTYLSPTAPTNWLTKFEFYATNTRDSIRETISLGDPVAINFSGYGSGIRYYPGTMDYKQEFSGPGVPGGTRVQFQLTQDWNSSTPGQFTWFQKVVDNTGALNNLVTITLDPTNAGDVANGFTTVPVDKTCLYGTCDLTIDPTTSSRFPSGPGKADYEQTTLYRDNSSVTVEKMLVSNDGKLFDFSNPTPGIFNKTGNYNLEILVKSSMFQGRDIDVLIAPEILAQKGKAATTADSLQP